MSEVGEGQVRQTMKGIFDQRGMAGKNGDDEIGRSSKRT